MLPYYGDVQLMQDAVRSVLVQTDPDFRLVVIDDGKEPDVPGWFERLGDERVHQDGEEMVIDNSTTVFQCRRHAVSESSVQAFSGPRLTEAARYFAAVAARTDARGWPKAARAARFHSASRLHDRDDERPCRLSTDRRQGRFRPGCLVRWPLGDARDHRAPTGQGGPLPASPRPG